MSRSRQLSVVGFVANAQKQGVMRAKDAKRKCAHSDRNIAKRGEDTRNQYKKSNWCKLNHERQTMFQMLEPRGTSKEVHGGSNAPIY